MDFVSVIHSYEVIVVVDRENTWGMMGHGIHLGLSSNTPILVLVFTIMANPEYITEPFFKENRLKYKN